MFLTFQSEFRCGHEAFLRAIHGMASSELPAPSSLLRPSSAIERLTPEFIRYIFRNSQFMARLDTLCDEEDASGDEKITYLSAILRAFRLIFLVLVSINEAPTIFEAIDCGMEDWMLPSTIPYGAFAPTFFAASSADRFVKVQYRWLMKPLAANVSLHTHYAQGELLPFGRVKGLGCTGTSAAHASRYNAKDLVCVKRWNATEREVRAITWVSKGCSRLPAVGPSNLDTEWFFQRSFNPADAHFVEYLGSYTHADEDEDHEYMGWYTVVRPVCEFNLEDLMLRPELQRQVLGSSGQTTGWLRLMNCICTSLEYLHGKNMYHGNLHPRNILLKDGRVYISEYGVPPDTLRMNGSALNTVYHHHLPWHYNLRFAADVFALGSVLAEMLVVANGGTVCAWEKIRNTPAQVQKQLLEPVEHATERRVKFEIDSEIFYPAAPGQSTLDTVDTSYWANIPRVKEHLLEQVKDMRHGKECVEMIGDMWEEPYWRADMEDVVEVFRGAYYANGGAKGKLICCAGNKGN